MERSRNRRIPLREAPRSDYGILRQAQNDKGVILNGALAQLKDPINKVAYSDCGMFRQAQNDKGVILNGAFAESKDPLNEVKFSDHGILRQAQNDSLLKSSHCGFLELIKLSFFFLVQPFNCFSLLIASSTLSVCSK